MDGETSGLSKGVAQVVKRLFSDELFREEALDNPELAFESYSLDDEERRALKKLLGRPTLFSTIVSPDTGW